MVDKGKKLFFQLEKLLKQFLQTKTVTMTILIVDQMLNIVLIVKMSQLMKKNENDMEDDSFVLPLQSLARMVKLFQMTKKVIVLPLELCRKFFFGFSKSKNISNMFFICIYCIAGKHVTDY